MKKFSLLIPFARNARKTGPFSGVRQISGTQSRTTGMFGSSAMCAGTLGISRQVKGIIESCYQGSPTEPFSLEHPVAKPEDRRRVIRIALLKAFGIFTFWD
jgi:hypothetical protein